MRLANGDGKGCICLFARLLGITTSRQRVLGLHLLSRVISVSRSTGAPVIPTQPALLDVLSCGDRTAN